MLYRENSRMAKVYVLVFALIVLILAGCVGPATLVPAFDERPNHLEEAPTERPAASATPLPTGEAAAATETTKPTEAPPASGAAFWKADGIIAEGEYAHEATVGGVRLWWRNDAEYLYIAFEAKTNGWVAVGLDPERRMKGANYLIGILSEGQVKVYDAYGTGEVGATHPADEELGGKDNIVAFAGVQEGGLTRFEVQIPLDSGDPYDKPLKPGEAYTVIAASSGSAQFNAPHTSRSSGQMTLDVTQ